MKKHEKELTTNIKSKPKSFWKYTKSKTRYQKQVCTLTSELAQHVTDDEKAQALNDAFSSVFVKEDCTHSPCLEETDTNIPMEEITVNEELILHKIKLLNEHKAWKPDNVHPKLLKEYAGDLAVPLSKIFDKSLSSGEVPSQRRKASVTAVHKKGNRHHPLNYRPISLTSIVCKLLKSF